MEGTGTYANSVVPECHIVLLPLVANVDLLGGSNNLVEIADNRIALRFGNAHDSCDESRVEEDRLPSGDRVCTYQWVLCYYRVTANRTTEVMRSICLDLCRVQSLKSFQVLLHAWRQEVIDSVLR